MVSKEGLLWTRSWTFGSHECRYCIDQLRKIQHHLPVVRRTGPARGGHSACTSRGSVLNARPAFTSARQYASVLKHRARRRIVTCSYRCTQLHALATLTSRSVWAPEPSWTEWWRREKSLPPKGIEPRSSSPLPLACSQWPSCCSVTALKQMGSAVYELSGNRAHSIELWTQSGMHRQSGWAANKINYSYGRDLSLRGPAGNVPRRAHSNMAPPHSDQPWSISTRQNLRLQVLFLLHLISRLGKQRDDTGSSSIVIRMLTRGIHHRPASEPNRSTSLCYISTRCNLICSRGNSVSIVARLWAIWPLCPDRL
jgi:hypothetical protein